MQYKITEDKNSITNVEATVLIVVACKKGMAGIAFSRYVDPTFAVYECILFLGNVNIST